MAVHDVGDRVTLSAAFVDDAGDPADPTTVTLRIRHPDATVEVVDHASLTSTVTGTWSYDVDIDESGIWRYRFEGTGAVVSAEESWLFVRRSAFTDAELGS